MFVDRAMLPGLVRPLVSALGVMLGVSVLVFTLIHLIPGDPVDVMLGEYAKAADRHAMREALGLNMPLHEQLLTFLSGLARGDLGSSVFNQRPVMDLLLDRFPATLQLALSAMFVATAAAIPLGVAAARYHDRWPDRTASTFALLALSIPNFWLGPLLMLAFSIGLGWTPVSGKSGAISLVLPALTLGLSLAAVTTRMVRSSVLEVMGHNYIRTGLAKGLSQSQVLWIHGLPNASLPVLTLLGLQFGNLLAGAVITEVIFNWPGVGSLLIDAIKQRDYPVVQGCILLITASYVFVNAATDVLSHLIDPRLRHE